MFLVILRCHCDELPVRLFDDRVVALGFAKALDVETTLTQMETLGFATSDTCNVAIVDFVDGAPVKMEDVRSLS